MPPKTGLSNKTPQRRQEGCKASHFPFKQLGVFMNLNDVKVLLNKKFGEGCAMSLSMNEEPLRVPALCTTGFKGLDSAIGIGGYPKGRIVEVFGPESSGKTTLALHACAEVQKIGGHVVYIDAEHALDLRYAKNGVGVDTENMLVCQPDYGEQGIDIVIHALSVNKDDPSTPLLIVVDSVDALQPQKILKGDFDPESDESKSNQPGQHAKMMSAACRKITAALKDTNATVLFINQIRSKIGVIFGSPENTTGGHALKFYSSVRLDIRNIGQYKKGELVIGNHFKVKVRKNKVARPFAEYEGLNLHGYGYQKDWDAFVYLQDKGYITKKGSWQTIESLDLKFQGYNGFVELLQNEENKVVIDDLLALE